MTIRKELINQIDVDISFLNKIIFTDESTLHLEEVVNCYNYRIRDIKLPAEIIQK